MNQLLPLNTRVTHFDGGPGTHGTGTIIDYNGVQPNTYFQEKPKEAIEMAAKAGLVGALITSAYDGVRCPYVVRWDYRQEFFDRFPHLKNEERHKDGYVDVYEPDSIRVVEEPVIPKV